MNMEHHHSQHRHHGHLKRQTRPGKSLKLQKKATVFVSNNPGKASSARPPTPFDCRPWWWAFWCWLTNVNVDADVRDDFQCDDNYADDNDGDDNDGDWAPLPCQSKALGPLLQETSTPPQEAPISPYYQQHVIQSSGSLFEFDSKLE